ncbi:hypothetical protein HZB78_04665 [Candidatus Collierbacteria bacterium]|nr:hypothetical protein [Candidatus Collierbacteria bacterium]
MKVRDIFVILATLIFLGKVGLFFWQNPNFSQFWDWPGHLEKATVADWPWKSGWDTAFWGGYPTWTYPNFYHLLLKFFIYLFKSETLGIISLTILIFCLQLHGLWKFTEKELKPKPQLMRLSFLTTVIIMAYAGGSFMGSFLGTLFTGGGPGSLATALLFYLIAFRDSGLGLTTPSGWFLGLLFLTHPLTAMVAIAYLFISMLLFLINKDPIGFKKSIFTCLTGFLIGLPWILTKLDPSFKTAAFNLPSSPTLFPWIIIVILILMVINDKSKFSPLILTTILLGGLSVLPDNIIRGLEGFGIRGIHFFRFSWYMMIMFPPILISLAKTSGKNKIYNRTIAAFTAITLFAILIGPQPRDNIKFNSDFSEVKNFSGRVMDVSRHTFKLDYPQAMEHALIKNTNLSGSTRWIFESGSKGLMFYSLKNALEPQSFKDGVYLSLFNDSFGNPRRKFNVKKIADLLGVNYIAYTTTDLQPAEKGNIWKIGDISWNDNNGDKFSLNYFLERIEGVSLVDSLDYNPEIAKDLNLGEWWLDPDKINLYIDGDSQVPPEVNLSQPEISNLRIHPMKISFTVESEKPAPVVVKFNYSPYWVASSANENFTSQPQWITPGNILIYASGPINLIWKTPRYLSLFGLFSTAYFTLATILLIKKTLFHKP